MPHTARPATSSFIDSYDSSVGPYGGANVHKTARVATNTTTSCRIDLDNADIEGDVFIGPDGVPSTVVCTAMGER